MRTNSTPSAKTARFADISEPDYVFVDEHNRHKRLKGSTYPVLSTHTCLCSLTLPPAVMRACEGCRRRKIKCDAATTNTWPCSACIRLRLHCVRPNGQFDSEGYETSPSSSDYANPPPMQDNFRQMPMGQQQAPIMPNPAKPGPAMYAAQAAYPENPSIYQPVAYGESPTGQQNFHYGNVAPPMSVMGGQQYDPSQHMPSPPHQGGGKDDGSPEVYGHDDSYQQQDLSDLLGSLRVDEAGSGE